MIYGVCGGPEVAGIAARIGYEYFEWTVGGYLQPLKDEADFIQTLEIVQAAPLPCPVVNVFFPGSLKITGPDVDWDSLTRYVETAVQRAQTAGVERIVFGSGGARQIPEGFPREAAMDQLVQFGWMVGQQGARCGVAITVEPLNRQECNVLNSVEETAAYVRAVGHPSVSLLVDAYHWAVENEPVESIVQSGDLISHAHIATPARRLPPGVEAYDFRPFLDALGQTGYRGRLSIEARLENTEAELRKAFDYLTKG